MMALVAGLVTTSTTKKLKNQFQNKVKKVIKLKSLQT
jgi:hypothetical protein